MWKWLMTICYENRDPELISMGVSGYRLQPFPTETNYT
jgi:hypothetical protein